MKEELWAQKKIHFAVNNMKIKYLLNLGRYSLPHANRTLKPSSNLASRLTLVRGEEYWPK